MSSWWLIVGIVAGLLLLALIIMLAWFRQDKNAEKGLQKVHSSTSTIRPGGEP